MLHCITKCRDIFKYSIASILYVTSFAFGMFHTAQELYAQDLETIGKEQPLKVSGGISVAQTAYAASGISSNRDPYNYFLSGNLNFSLYGWSVPLSFNYSNQGASFQQPFNQYGISPTYKWISLHAGYRSMTFSPYTLNGHLFLGGGVDLAPRGIFRLSAMYGRLQKGVEVDTTNDQNVPAFERWGYGVKVGVVKDNDYAHVILFRARDQISSLSILSDDLGVSPWENVVFGFSGKKNLFTKFSLVVDWASSAITRDQRAPESTNTNSVFSKMGGFYTLRNSSSIYQAFKANLNYAASSYSVGLNYERIDPGYQTLGAYYFNNDLENITVSSSVKLGKASFSANVGIQQNDLDNVKASKMNRLVASVSGTVSPTERLQANLSFSNFTSYTRLKPKFDDYVGGSRQQSDTISSRYSQINQTANAGITYRIGNNKNSLNAVVTMTTTTDEQDTIRTENSLYYAIATYNFSFPTVRLSANAGVNTSWTEEIDGQSVAIGPTLQTSRDFLEKKLRTSAGVTYNTILKNQSATGGVFNFRVTAGYKVAKRHNFNLSVMNVLRKDRDTDKAITELTGNLNYAYAF